MNAELAIGLIFFMLICIAVMVIYIDNRMTQSDKRSDKNDSQLDILEATLMAIKKKMKRVISQVPDLRPLKRSEIQLQP